MPLTHYFSHLKVMKGLLQFILGAGAHKMREDVLEVADEDLSSVAVELSGNCAYQSGGSGGGLSC